MDRLSSFVGVLKSSPAVSAVPTRIRLVPASPQISNAFRGFWGMQLSRLHYQLGETCLHDVQICDDVEQYCEKAVVSDIQGPAFQNLQDFVLVRRVQAAGTVPATTMKRM